MSSSSSSPTKTLIHTFFTSHLHRLSRALIRARSFLFKLLTKPPSSSSSRPVHFFIYFTRNKKNKIHFGSFRLHYNWCSSRSWSVPTSVLPEASGSHREVYYDSSWQSEEVVGGDFADSSELSGYLRWLEEKKAVVENIDELADMFIAQCREKFVLEKQESERKFREMLARSM